MAVILNTSLGDIVIDLHTDLCPLTTKNFLKLCKYVPPSLKQMSFKQMLPLLSMLFRATILVMCFVIGVGAEM